MEDKRKQTIHEMCVNALLATVYAVLTIFIAPIAYGPIQFRFSEVLVLFCFFNKRYAIGLTLGCLIANCFSPTAILDVPFGTLATLLACLGIIFCKHLLVAVAFPVVCNAFIIAIELALEGIAPFWLSVLTVGAGELAVLTLGYIFFISIKRSRGFFRAIKATQNTEFKF